MTDDLKMLEAARALHRPVPTGRTEYRTDAAGAIRGIEETFTCPTCAGGWYFADQFACETYRALTTLPDSTEGERDS